MENFMKQIFSTDDEELTDFEKDVLKKVGIETQKYITENGRDDLDSYFLTVITKLVIKIESIKKILEY